MTSSLLFSSYALPSPAGGLVLPNRIVIAPMCQYAATNGQATDWHQYHWTNLLNSGAGLLILEATAVEPQGRISPGCLGLWDDATEAALTDRLQRARALAPAMPVCMQISHAGRKASSAAPWHGGALLPAEQGGWPTFGPSALPHLPHETPPAALTPDDLDRIEAAFVNTAKRAARAGIDALEIHAAHGYLLHQFLSPLANQRTDGWGGDYAGRTAFPKRVLRAVRGVFDGPVGVRLSATDWVEGGWTLSESEQLSIEMKALGANFVHVSSAGVSPLQKIPVGPLYQVDLAQAVRQASQLPTMAVGLITTAAQAEAVLQQGQADLVALARAFLYDPRWAWHAAAELGASVPAQTPYWRCAPASAGALFQNARIGMR